MSEKDFEDIICKYPELIEEGLIFKGRQIHVYGKIMDVLFEDKFCQKLIVELKIGPIDRKHIGQVMEYEGSVLSVQAPNVRIMLIGNRVPPNLRKALDYHGIEWREITLLQLQDFLKQKADTEFLKHFQDDEGVLPVVVEEKVSPVAEKLGKDIVKDNIDWRLPESHLALINNNDTRARIDYIRNKIKSLGSDIAERGRQNWIMYRAAGKLFVNIGEIRKNGKFTVAVQLPAGEVKLEGHESRDWGTDNATFITFEKDADLKDMDKLFDYIQIAYKRVIQSL